MPSAADELIEPPVGREPSEAERRAAARLSLPASTARVLPIRCAIGDAPRDVAATVASLAGARVIDATPAGRGGRDDVLTMAWLSGAWVFIDARRSAAPDLAGRLPACTICVATDGTRAVDPPGAEVLAALRPPALSMDGRIAAWRRALGEGAGACPSEIERCAHRFRIGPEAIVRAALLARADRPGGMRTRLEDACRSVVGVDLGELAEPIEPEVGADDLVLPPRQRRLMDELVEGIEALPHAHSTLGAHAGRGLSAAFCGPSGTGKSLGVRVLAARVGLPLYRVDLSQVVNKFVGETPKRLKALFDATEVCDLILWFDEADSFFGRRIAASNAQDRWACMEVNYLLQRMDGARAVTVLTTNRKDELDQAFLRRLQFVIDFAFPEERERVAIWERAVAPDVRAPDLDLTALGRRFRLTGAQIGAAATMAGLRAARETATPRISMEHALLAIWRELEKENRPFNPSHFGPHAALVERVREGGSP
jgi:hypothetical protein